MKLDVKDLGRASAALFDIFIHGDHSCYERPPTDYRLVLEKVRESVVSRMRDGTRLGTVRCSAAFELALDVLKREGYVELSPIGISSDFAIALTDSGSERVFHGERPEFGERDLGTLGTHRKRERKDTMYGLVVGPRTNQE
jgi:hypothetical protein